MNVHDPDDNPLLDNLAQLAPSSLSFWLTEAESAINGQFGGDYAERHPAAVAGYLNACATVYQAHLLADHLASVSNAIAMLPGGTVTERLAGIEVALDQLAELARRAVGKT